MENKIFEIHRNTNELEIVPVQMSDSTKLIAKKFPQGISLQEVYYTVENLQAIENDEFWKGLAVLGPDQTVRIERIKELFPITTLSPDPRKNRRKLYESILFLRYESECGWELDKRAEKRGIAIEPSSLLAKARRAVQFFNPAATSAV